MPGPHSGHSPMRPLPLAPAWATSRPIPRRARAFVHGHWCHGDPQVSLGLLPPSTTLRHPCYGRLSRSRRRPRRGARDMHRVGLFSCIKRGRDPPFLTIASSPSIRKTRHPIRATAMDPPRCSLRPANVRPSIGGGLRRDVRVACAVPLRSKIDGNRWNSSPVLALRRTPWLVRYLQNLLYVLPPWDSTSFAHRVAPGSTGVGESGPWACYSPEGAAVASPFVASLGYQGEDADAPSDQDRVAGLVREYTSSVISS
jgi:hypothetical protein